MDQIEQLLTRGVDSIYPSKEALEKVLRSGKKLTLYQGFDPTGTQLHIGHAVGFRKLRQWQDLGHHVIFLIGDGTGLAGDPSGKMKARGRFMSRQELRDNAVSYLKQASKIVRFEGENPIEIRYNGDWLTKLKLEDILNIAQNFTVQQMIERDMYQTRIKAGDPINLREFLYPILQGYDSVVMKVDLEQGGTDQTFNMLAGRTLVKAMLGKEKFVMTVPLLADSKGVKIGKTEGNVIGLTDAPNDLYAKIMSLSDDAIVPCFKFLTDLPMEEIESMKQEMKNGINPMNFKKKLAFELTKYLHAEKEAQEAQEQFVQTFQKKDLSKVHIEETPIAVVPNANNVNIVDLVSLGDLRLASSRSEAKRQIIGGAVEINGKKILDTNAIIKLNPGDIIKVGKVRFKKFIK
ncbi:MAG TPA: tyrosine--tRNA ligase [Patescibacteria group bacterium]|nr:tyrosine--tRNA ligase [Patescibacteria group bacterium]